MDISVVVPVYGCPAAIGELHRRLTESLSVLTQDYEIILVNDRCPKNSWAEIEKVCQADQKVVGIELSRNCGQEVAILAGLDYSTGKWVVVMDCDLQDRPEEIVRLYAKAQEGYDAVIARRAERQDKKMKIFVSKCFYKVYSYATDTYFDPALCNFGIYSRIVIDSVCQMREIHRGFVMFVMWLGFRWAPLDVEHNQRYEGESGYNFSKRMKMALEILTSQSDKLLRLMATLGMGIAALAFLFIFVTIIRYFMMDIDPGYSSLISAVFLMGGLIIASIGAVGIYVGNIFIEVKHRPLYVARTVLNGNTEHNEVKKEQRK